VGGSQYALSGWVSSAQLAPCGLRINLDPRAAGKIHLHDHLPTPAVESSDVVHIVAIEFRPLWVGPSFCHAKLHEVEPELIFIEVITCSCWVPVDLTILLWDFSSNLNLIECQNWEGCLFGYDLTDSAPGASVRSMLSCISCKIASSTSQSAYSRYHSASLKVKDSSVNWDKTCAA
jgi:hypothetical protein